MKEIEQKAIEISKSVLESSKTSLTERGCRFGEIEFNQTGDGDSYFSEIEVYIWKKNNVINVFNLILFLNGKQLIAQTDLSKSINSKIEEIIKTCK